MESESLREPLVLESELLEDPFRPWVVHVADGPHAANSAGAMEPVEGSTRGFSSEALSPVTSSEREPQFCLDTTWPHRQRPDDSLVGLEHQDPGQLGS
jgi:hypothetical protein